MAERTLDLFWLLGQMDLKNYDAFAKLTEEQQKEVSPYMLLRWLAGSLDEPEQLVNLADIAAPLLFELTDKELLYKLLTACTVGGMKKYRWVNFKAKTKKKSLALGLIAATYQMPLRHAADVIGQFTADELEELTLAQGWQKNEIAELKKEIKS